MTKEALREGDLPFLIWDQEFLRPGKALACLDLHPAGAKLICLMRCHDPGGARHTGKRGDGLLKSVLLHCDKAGEVVGGDGDGFYHHWSG